MQTTTLISIVDGNKVETIIKTEHITSNMCSWQCTGEEQRGQKQRSLYETTEEAEYITLEVSDGDNA